MVLWLSLSYFLASALVFKIPFFSKVILLNFASISTIPLQCRVWLLKFVTHFSLPPSLLPSFPLYLSKKEISSFFLSRVILQPRLFNPHYVARADLELLILSPLSSRFHHVLVILYWESGSDFVHVRPAFYKLSIPLSPKLGIFKAKENSLQPSVSVVNTLALFHLFYFTFPLWSKADCKIDSIN